MSAFEVLIGALMLVILLVVLLQPFYGILNATSSLFPNDYVVSIIGLVGIAAIIGFIIWIYRVMTMPKDPYGGELGGF